MENTDFTAYSVHKGSIQADNEMLICPMINSRYTSRDLCEGTYEDGAV